MMNDFSLSLVSATFRMLIIKIHFFVLNPGTKRKRKKNILEKGKATHSSSLAWRIPRTGQAMGSQSQTGLSNFHFHRIFSTFPITMGLQISHLSLWASVSSVVKLGNGHEALRKSSLHVSKGIYQSFQSTYQMHLLYSKQKMDRIQAHI